MRILITNNTLADYAGTEIYARDVALGMKGRDYQVSAFTLEPGVVADELREAGIPVFNDTNAVRRDAKPDLIHGQHLFETSLAALAFPDVPVVSFCHGPIAWQETPCRLPNVVRWIAVDHRCRQRLTDEEGIRRERIEVLFNFVDTDRFTRRADPLPHRPTRALVFSNTMADCAALRAAEEACAERGIKLDVIGRKAGTQTDEPENILPGYDLVFAKARAAIEAMAAGCGVVLLDWFGAGEFIAPDSFDRLREVNFGYAAMAEDTTAGFVGSQVDRYDPSLAAAVTDRIREGASLGVALDRLEEIYQNVANTELPRFDPLVAGSDFLRLEAVLAKRYLSGVKNARHQPLQLPPGPLPAEGNLRQYVEDFLAHHDDPARRLSGLREKTQQLQQRLEEERAKKERLKTKVAALEARLAVSRGGGWMRKILGTKR